MRATLVIGGGGTVGVPLAGELARRGVAVRAFVRDRARARALLGPEVELAQGDLGDRASIDRALTGVGRVFLACSNHPRQLEYEANAIDACAAAGVERVVKLSTIGARIGSPSAFWDCHGRIEERLRASGLPAVVLRASFYMSNLLMAAEPIRAAGALPDGARIAMIDPRDVAAVAALALTEEGHEGRVYTLTGPEAVTYTQVAERLSAATGRPVEFLPLPDQAAREGMLGAGMPEWLADQVLILFRLLRGGAAEQVTDVVRVLLGREPLGLGRFLRDHAALFTGLAAPAPVMDS